MYVRRKSPSWIWALCPTLVLFGLAVLYGNLNFYRDPGSVFFDPGRATERGYSLYREREANLWRNTVLAQHAHGVGVWKAGPSPTISGVILTVHRPKLAGTSPLEVRIPCTKHRLTKQLSVTSALAGLTQAEREDIDLRVFFADTDPTKHPFHNSSLVDLLDGSFAPRDIMSKGELAIVTGLEEKKDYMDKVRFDFAYALRHVYRTSSSPYIALFEGDIMVADGWVARAVSALREVDRRVEKEGLRWSDMRMFNAEGMIAFNSLHPLGNNVPFIILGVSGVLFLVFRALARVSRTGREVFTWQFNVVVCCVTVPAFVVLFFRAGKSSMLPPRAGVSVQNWGMCTQGMIMPRAVVPGLADAIIAHRDQPDRSFRDFAADNGYDRLVLDPILVQHMGE
jgi:hypothetical protein